VDVDRLEETQDTGPDWSVSRLETIFACGRKYEYKYVKHTEEPKTVPLAFGSAVHKCLETMHWLGKWDDSYLSRLWSDVWYEAQDGIDWDSVRERKSNKDKKGLEILEAYRETNGNDEWYALESHFRFQPDPDYPVLRGTWDKVMRLRGLEGDLERYNGRLAVIDYKTSKNPPSPLLLRVNPQLTIYHQAAKKVLGEDVVMGIHHLLSNKVYLTERVDKDMDAVLEMLYRGTERVDNKEFERNISFNCNWCPFKETCLGSLINGESES
jgi:CRISPR/Cas system-associated exonuclease Cas4 (RecB family)